MRNRHWKLFTFLAALLAVWLFVPEELYARRGGRISFGRSRSFSRSSSRAKSWGSTKANKPRLGGSRSGQTAGRASTTDRRVLDRARSQGTLYNSRADANKAFQSKYASQYTSKYATQPATRPTHIPQTTTVSGQQYNVGYNQQYGGYGYMMGGGWRPYSTMGDVAMMSLLMNRHGYAWGGGYGYRPYRSFLGGGLMSGLAITMIIVGIGFALRKSY
ncbi:MAG: hypothetical protein GY953_57810 [bacterium]|nr:hypothetical protein [bacterium]